jgi:DNA polymerase IV (DinB-like DNA polymerase)
MRIIAHLDMDAFFAAVEERDRPDLRGLPVVIGADPRAGRGRGVVSTANYKARAYGIHSALPITRAWRLSEAARRQGKPAAVFLRVDMEKYAAVSARIMAIVRQYSPRVEQASIDEAYFDLSTAESYEHAVENCRALKLAICETEQLTASIGVGPNKLVAKIASGIKKPDGLTVVRAEQAEAFLEPLPVRAIPGIGPKTETFLAERGIRLIQDLKRLSRDDLAKLFGKRGLDFYDKVRGVDESPIEPEYQVKSIGEQETFDRDTRDRAFLADRVVTMCADVLERLHGEGFTQFRTVVLTVRFADFETKTRAHTLPVPAGDPAALQGEALTLLEPFLDGPKNPRRKLIRLLGVRVEKLR